MTAQVRLIAILMTVAGILAAVFFIYERGRDDAKQAVERQNNRAATTANERAMSYNECDRLDGVYDFYTGKCRLNP